MKLSDIYELADIERVPAVAKGSAAVKIKNRTSLQKALTSHRRMYYIYIGVLFITILAIIISGLVLAIKNPDKITQGGIVPYLGGASFLAMLEVERRLLKTLYEGGLFLLMVEYASDDQLANYIEASLKIKQHERAASPRTRNA